MSDREITRVPSSLRGDDGRVPAAGHAPKRPDTTSAEYERQREHLIGHGRSFAEVEERINRIPLSDDEKSALWLYAWSLTKTTLADRGAHHTPSARLSAVWRCAWSFTEIDAQRSGGSRPAGWGSREPDRGDAMAAGGLRLVAINRDRYERPEHRPERRCVMPRIIVQAHALDGRPGVVTMAERVVPTGQQNDHYTAQLIERVGWAVLDAERLESQSIMCDPDGPTLTRTILTNRPDARTPGLAERQPGPRQRVAEAEVSG